MSNTRDLKNAQFTFTFKYKVNILNSVDIYNIKISRK